MESKTYPTVLSDYVSDGVRVITLNRPQSLNAMNRQLVDDVTEAFDHANACSDTRAIVFTGAGDAFCAGDDRNQHAHPENENAAREFVMAIQAASQAILFGETPVVGAINGWAVGGGLEWAINCDFPIWSSNARAFFPEVSLNLFVTGAVTSLLPAMTGLARAREMLFLGERYNAETLYEYGVAWKVCEEDVLMEQAIQTAEKIAALPPAAARAMKLVVNTVSVNDLRHALALETEVTVAQFMDPETTILLKANFQ